MRAWAACILLVLLSACGNATDEVADLADAIEFVPELVDLGIQKHNARAELTAYLQNLGSLPFFVDDVTAGCSCIAPLLDSDVIAPGATATLTASMDFRRRGMQHEEIVAIGHYEGSSKRLLKAVRIQGRVLGNIVCEPPRLVLDGSADQVARVVYVHYHHSASDKPLGAIRVSAPTCLIVSEIERGTVTKDAGDLTVTTSFRVMASKPGDLDPSGQIIFSTDISEPVIVPWVLAN